MNENFIPERIFFGALGKGWTIMYAIAKLPFI